ncbi:MAG TPA: CTP synthase [Patescibacteria group bacterium]|nr:CTP synthase [Patescibacteria group bacterium]
MPKLRLKKKPKKQTKYIFVTGGVLSGLGKGITAASIGNILKARGFSVFMQKFDQYLNVDAGTLNPAEHGEVFVTDDGAETDLDLGHYERFIDTNLTKASSVMTGQIYRSILDKERSGYFLGKTIQVIPHVTDEVKERIKKAARESQADILITEIGGTVGDYEGTHFIEAIRQMSYDVGRENVLYIHVGFVPYLAVSEELKTKPLQNSVHDLQAMGIQPDVVVARSDYPIRNGIINKIALFSGVSADSVIPLETVSTVYEVPLILERWKLDTLIIKKLSLPNAGRRSTAWSKLVAQIKKPKKHKLKVALVGKYMGMKDTYLSVTEALKSAGLANNAELQIEWIDAEKLSRKGTDQLKGMDAILVPGGFGKRGVEGKILAAQYAREKKIPYLGLCLGLQIAVIEFARNVCRLREATSMEFNGKSEHQVIHVMPDQEKKLLKREYGGSMRLGAWVCAIKPGTLAFEAYGESKISERHRHRYEVNNKYRKILEARGLVISGTTTDNQLVEIVELRDHPFFMGVQFHPEFKSRPLSPGPVFRDFIKSAVKLKQQPKISSKTKDKPKTRIPELVKA